MVNSCLEIQLESFHYIDDQFEIRVYVIAVKSSFSSFLGLSYSITPSALSKEVFSTVSINRMIGHSEYCFCNDSLGAYSTNIGAFLIIIRNFCFQSYVL